MSQTQIGMRLLYVQKANFKWKMTSIFPVEDNLIKYYVAFQHLYVFFGIGTLGPFLESPPLSLGDGVLEP